MQFKSEDQSNTNKGRLSWGEKLLSAGAEINPGEGKNIYFLMQSLFFLLVTAYLLKPVREMLILTQGGSEIRSYAVALQALLLIVLIPVYGILTRKFETRKFMVCIALFFSLNMLMFYVWGITGHKGSVAFFVWLGAYGVLMVSQFWAFASQVYDKQTGERLFALVALGAAVGAWVGAALSRWLVEYLGPYDLILLSIFTLLFAIYFAVKVKIDEHFKVPRARAEQKKVSYWSGFSLVAKSRYLVLIALFVILLNWVNSTGEYLLAVLVELFYEQGATAGTLTESKETFIGEFYSEFYLMVNLVGVFIQFFVVSRLIKWAGFQLSFVITPVLVCMGYGILSFFPIIALFRVVKVTENGLDYSLQNTTRQILFLPTSRREKYEGRAVIDTVCWRIGDLFQAGAVFVGLNILNILPRQFVMLNVVLAFAMIVLGYYISQHYQHKVETAEDAETNGDARLVDAAKA